MNSLPSQRHLQQLNRLSACAAVLWLITAIASQPAQAAEDCAPPIHFASKSGRYLIDVIPDNHRLPLNKYIGMEVRIRERMKPVNYPLEITVDAGMRQHGHGMLTLPESRQLENGVYRVEGMLFHMPGEWQLMIELQRGVVRDMAETNITVQGLMP